jgi:FtsZ-binding cell division protein ZapB
MAANHDPNQMYDSIQALVEERDELKKANNKLRAENATLKAERNTLELENKGLGESWESTKLDYRVARDKLDKMEYICGLQSAKQVILWKFIERLQNGETGPPIGEDGFWRLRKGSMAPVSEASEPSSDQSYASTVGSKDSSETKLDPHAVGSVCGESNPTDL